MVDFPDGEAWKEIPREEPDAQRSSIQRCGNNRWKFSADGQCYEIEGQVTRDGMKVVVSMLEGDTIVFSSTVQLESTGSRKYYATNAILVETAKSDIERHLLGMYLALKDFKEQEENPRPETLSLEDRKEAEEFLKSHDLIDRIDQDLAALGIVGEKELRLAVYITATSRKLRKPLALSIVGSSSSGKSYVLETVATLLPASEVNVATARTQESLYYLRSDSLRHVFVVTKEFNPEDEGSLAMRELLSAGQLSKDIPIRDRSTGQFETKKIEVEGPIAYCDSTTRLFRYEEDQTRILRVYTDESQHQTEQIHDAQRTGATLQGLRRQVLAEEIRRRHVAAQCLLETEGDAFVVTIPFAHAIDFPSERVEYRRRFPHFLTAIKAIALLRQTQREVKEDTIGGLSMRYLEATLEDYETAREIIGPYIEQAFKDLDKKSEEALETIEENYEGQTFLARDMQRWLKVGKSQANERLQVLVDAGRIEVREASRGNKPAVYAMSTGSTTKVASLPTREQIASRLSEADEEEVA